MITLKKLIPVALCGCLLLSACDTKNDPKTPEVPAITIDGTKLLSYPAERIPSSGAVDLGTVTEVASSVFAGKTALKSVKAMALQKIGDKAFSGATALMSLELGSLTLPETHASAFEGTPSTKALLVPPAAVETYIDWARAHGFATINGKALSALYIAYDDAGVLTRYHDLLLESSGDVVLPAEVKTIPPSFFFGKEAVTSVTAPGVTQIGAKAFQGCTKLARVEFPSLSGELPAQLFSGCSVLSEVTLGDGVTGAVSDAFEDTPEGKKLYISPMVDRERHEVWAIASGFGLLNGVAIERERPGGLPEGFVADKRTIVSAPQIPNTLTNLVIPKYYQVLGPSCIHRNNHGGNYLLSVTGEGITRIEESALEGSTNLRTVAFPKVEYIGARGFYDASSLTRLELPECTELGKEAFSAGSRSELTEIILPKLKVWGQKAFSGHDKVVRVRLGATPPEVIKPSKYNPPIGKQRSAHKPKLEVPVGSKAVYKNWAARSFFGDIEEY